MKLILHYLFDDLGIHKIVAKTSANNKSSLIGLEKLGFKSEGLMCDFYRDKLTGNFFDAILMAKFNGQ